MHPGPGRSEQRATRSRPYLRRDSSRRPRELQGPGEPGESGGCESLSTPRAIDTSLLGGDEGYLPGLDWSSRERSLSGRLVQSLVSGFAIHLTVGLSEEEGDAFLGAVGVDRMEEAPVVEMEGDMEVVDAEFECRD